MSISPTHTQKASDRHAQLVKQAEKWVSQTFYGALLKQMRESPFKSKLFSGGEGGDAFSGLYDQQLADRMSKGAGGKLVHAIVRKIEGEKAYKKTAMGKIPTISREWSAR